MGCEMRGPRELRLQFWAQHGCELAHAWRIQCTLSAPTEVDRYEPGDQNFHGPQPHSSLRLSGLIHHKNVVTLG